MAKFLVYTAPTRGHLYPLVPTLDRLLEHGHLVFARTASSEVRTMLERGIGARPLLESVECALRTDWQQFSHEGATRSLLDHLVLRGEFEATDLKYAIDKHNPDALIIDATCFGAAAVAEASGIPWVSWSTQLLPFPRPGIPAFGLGIPLRQGTFSAIKNWTKHGSVQRTYDQALEQLNELRSFLGAAPLNSVLEWPQSLSELIYFTAVPFEYDREWPQSVHLVGPSTWEPYQEQVELQNDTRPIVLVSACCEYQDDAKMLTSVLAGLNPQHYQIVVTTASIEPQELSAFPDVTVTRFAAHIPILQKAACLVCPGNLGAVQKALVNGVPVLAIPQYRDQVEIGQRIKGNKAGLSIPLAQLKSNAVAKAVQDTIDCRPGATKLQEQFAQCDSLTAATEIIEKAIMPHEESEAAPE